MTLTPFEVATLAVALLASVPGFIALWQHTRDRTRTILTAHWSRVPMRDVWSFIVKNYGSADALHLSAYLYVRGRDRQEIRSIEGIPAGEEVSVEIGRGTYRVSPPITDIGLNTERVAIRLEWRVPPHNRRKRKVFRYKLPKRTAEYVRALERI
jgi:hypothetical protein